MPKWKYHLSEPYTIELSVTLASLIEPTSHIEIYHLKRYRSGESRIWFEMCIIMCVNVNLYSIGFSVLFFPVLMLRVK